MKMCYNIGKEINNIALHLIMVNTVIISHEVAIDTGEDMILTVHERPLLQGNLFLSCCVYARGASLFVLHL